MSGSIGAAWPTLTIAEVTKTSAGGTPKKSGKEFYEGGKIPWLLSGEVASRDIVRAKNFITSAGLKGSSAKLFPPGSVLVAMYGATAGEVGILRIEAATNQAVCAILPGEKHIPEYVYYYFLHAKKELVALAVGNAQPNISQAKIRSTCLPLPPLVEQKRIVAVLDQAFAALDRARAHAEANLADASRLFDENRNQLLLQASVGSSESALGELCEFVRGPFGGSLKKSIFKPSGYAVYEQQHAIHRRFQQFRYFVDEEKFAEMMRFRVKADDLIMSCSGTMGKVAIVPKGAPDGIINQALLKLTTGPDLVPAFLQRWMEGAAFQQQLSTNTLGVAIENVASVKTLKTLTIPLLSIQIQHKVVERIEALEVRTSELAGAYRAKLEDLKSLRQSLLQKAFSGELT